VDSRAGLNVLKRKYLVPNRIRTPDGAASSLVAIPTTLTRFHPPFRRYNKMEPTSEIDSLRSLSQAAKALLGWEVDHRSAQT
jgi:hypothetical protein